MIVDQLLRARPITGGPVSLALFWGVFSLSLPLPRGRFLAQSSRSQYAYTCRALSRRRVVLVDPFPVSLTKLTAGQTLFTSNQWNHQKLRRHDKRLLRDACVAAGR